MFEISDRTFMKYSLAVKNGVHVTEADEGVCSFA